MMSDDDDDDDDDDDQCWLMLVKGQHLQDTPIFDGNIKLVSYVSGQDSLSNQSSVYWLIKPAI